MSELKELAKQAIDREDWQELERLVLILKEEQKTPDIKYVIAGIYSARTTPKIHIAKYENGHYTKCQCRCTGTQGLAEWELEEFLEKGKLENYRFGLTDITIEKCKKCFK